MSVTNRSLTVRKLVESAILIGIATVLNEFVKFDVTWLYGGSVTLGSMLPLVLIAWRWGFRQGLLSCFVFSLIQLLLGIRNVTYGQNAFQMLAIAFLDYILAYSAYSLGGLLRDWMDNKPLALALGIVLAGAVRFLCHFISGWMIWDALWPNEQGLSGAVYSLVYNGGYMLPEVIVAVAIGLLLFAPLKKYWLGEDLSRARV
ncbi:MAG: energy-coupled thiamine transporter ThiT [Eubacteriales bacterium]|nr:energy-coupled thiamine transporter ThiT [Eubacteriales bacterium]